jgi:RNA polymerase sigma factor (sigma-70 family)
MNPPPAEGLASRLFLGPALRTQPDRRLVTLVRDGYDTAFEEIVRRYGKALTRYAAAIVGGRSEDVTQDAFSKALLALRRDSGAEIDLRPWLYRIVRNTALNDLRDRPPEAAELTEALGAHSLSAAEEAERREELAELMQRLRDLPEPQRAAIVMRELEGLGHEEIASALGLSGGGARQAIYRARQALRDGLGLLVPLPLLRVLIEYGADATAGAAAAGAAGAGGAAAAMGGAGAGTALKVGVVTAVLAGSVGTGLAIKENRAHDPAVAETAAAATPAGGGEGARGASSAAEPESAPAAAGSEAGEGHGGEGHGSGGPGGTRGAEGGDDSSGPGPARHQQPDDDGHRGSGHAGRGDGGGHSGPEPSQEVSGHGGSGSGGGGSGPGDGGLDSSGGGTSGSDGGTSGSGPGPGGSLLPPPEGDSFSGSGSGSSDSGSGSGSGSSGPGSGDLLDD